VNDDELLNLVTTLVADETQTAAYRVTAKGEIDLQTAPRLAETLDSLIEQGAKLVVLEAAEVEFLDSSGLRVIINAGNALHASGGQLLIEGMSGAVQRVLEISGLIEQYRG
jgi:anti-sigma B factor antagonist